MLPSQGRNESSTLSTRTNSYPHSLPMEITIVCFRVNLSFRMSRANKAEFGSRSLSSCSRTVLEQLVLDGVDVIV